MAFWILVLFLCSTSTSMRGAFARVTRKDVDRFEKMALELPIDSCDSILINSPFQGKTDAQNSSLYPNRSIATQA